MTELSVLERVRAAVAEAGYDPVNILAGDGPDDFMWWWGGLPEQVVWRAKETVGVGANVCWQCWSSSTWQICIADRRFVEDCGRDRGEP